MINNWRPRCRALCTLFLVIAALWTMVRSGRAQLYVGQYSANTVGEYDTTTGAPINASLITGLSAPTALTLSANDLFVANSGSGTVGEYNAATGAAINASLITGLIDPEGLALSGNNLFVVNISGPIGTVGEYNATTGAAINASLITGLNGPVGLALSGNNLFVAESSRAGRALLTADWFLAD